MIDGRLAKGGGGTAFGEVGEVGPARINTKMLEFVACRGRSERKCEQVLLRSPNLSSSSENRSVQQYLVTLLRRGTSLKYLFDEALGSLPGANNRVRLGQAFSKSI